MVFSMLRLSHCLLTLPLLTFISGVNAITQSASKTFVSAVQDGVNLNYVENSGICETTPGVQQVSGYVNVGTNMSMVCVRFSQWEDQTFSKGGAFFFFAMH